MPGLMFDFSSGVPVHRFSPDSVFQCTAHFRALVVHVFLGEEQHTAGTWLARELGAILEQECRRASILRRHIMEIQLKSDFRSIAAIRVPGGPLETAIVVRFEFLTRSVE